MRWIHAVAAAVAATGLISSVAKASLTVSIKPLQITSQAKTADANLNGARSFEMDVTQTGGEKWNVTTMQLTLPTTDSLGHALTGSFYQAAGASVQNGAHVLQPTFANTSPLFYDTAVTSPMSQINSDGSRANVLGNSDYPSTAGAGSVAVQSSNVLNVAWGDVLGTSSTTTTDGVAYPIARFTITGNVGAYFQGYVAGNLNLTGKQSFTTYIPLSGDADSDGVVGGGDSTIVRNNFGQSVTVGTNGDVDFATIVGGGDSTTVRNNFGNQLNSPGAPPPGSALGSLVPEPASAVVLLVAGALACGRRRRAM